MAAGTHITAQRAQEVGIKEQGETESDDEFRARVSGQLREMGLFIEAHEAFTNMLYDDPSGNPMLGIIGATALSMHPLRDPAKDGIHQIGDDRAAGHLVQSPNDNIGEFAVLAVLLGLR